ncbi:cyclin-dependent kinase G-2-like isoform X1 [Olea europaea subsp. europaea]|uniref:cyclin-dependent kinase n=1 Tax=Olea europaea subsp. europaea TaxID=158383 RepID=A0A8S0SUV8_OLEEU|nr:cyclin-dependent kinase G-2-like isoform X1 [Olea europaea subsp. europaea]
MAAGRHGSQKDNEFKGRKMDLGLPKKEVGNVKGDNDRFRNGDWDNWKSRSGVRDRDSRDHTGRVRQKDIKIREVINGGYHSISNQSDSSSSGGGRRSELAVRVMDREPGELSSDGSDGASDLESRINIESEVKTSENGKQSLPVQNKKRKFSPIVWDRDDRELSRAFEKRNVSDTTNLPFSPPVVNSNVQSSVPSLDESVQVSPKHKCEVQNSKASFPEIDLVPEVLEVPVKTSSLSPNEECPGGDQGAEEFDAEDFESTRTIVSSRWANNADSPVDEGVIHDNGDTPKWKVRRSGTESALVWGHRKSRSPELGEVKAEGSKGTRGRSSGSDECVRSSSRDSYPNNVDKNDYMEIDEDRNYGATSVSQSDMESVDELGSCGTPETALTPERSVNMLRGCRSVDEFERLNKINEGTYGIVYRARDKKSGEIVALKKVKMEKEREGFPLTSLREINILLSFQHPSAVDVKEVVVGSNLDSIFMVMEYMEHDLKGLMETMRQPFSQSEVKCLTLQLLEGVKYLHDNWVLHRDLKTSNLLLNNRGELKICDFGLARQYGSPLKPYTHLVVTLWYRAPELLLGAKQYSTAIDMWSVGCIMAELLSKEPLFSGKTEFDQLDKIFRILGTPNETIWPGFSRLPGVKVNFVKNKYNQLRRKFPATSFTGSPVLSDAGFDLLNKLLTYDPDKRITAEAALKHEWFQEVPLPKSKEFMPTFPAQHVQDRRIRRAMKSPDPLKEQQRKELQQEELGAGESYGSKGVSNIVCKTIFCAVFSRHLDE